MKNGLLLLFVVACVMPGFVLAENKVELNYTSQWSSATEEASHKITGQVGKYQLVYLLRPENRDGKRYIRADLTLKNNSYEYNISAGRNTIRQKVFGALVDEHHEWRYVVSMYKNGKGIDGLSTETRDMLGTAMGYFVRHGSQISALHKLQAALKVLDLNILKKQEGVLAVFSYEEAENFSKPYHSFDSKGFYQDIRYTMSYDTTLSMYQMVIYVTPLDLRFVVTSQRGPGVTKGSMNDWIGFGITTVEFESNPEQIAYDLKVIRQGFSVLINRVSGDITLDQCADQIASFLAQLKKGFDNN